MAVTYIGNATYRGLAADTKPTTGVATNALFLVTDTGGIFTYNGATWLAAGGGNLDSLSDVVTPTPTVNHVLTWDGSNWVNALPPGASGGEANTASNVGTAGVGVWKNKVGVDHRFKKINAGSTKVTITDDTGNDEVDVDVAQANLALSSIGGSVTTGQLPAAVVRTDQAQTFGDFFQQFRSGRLTLRDSDASHAYIFVGANLAADRNVSFPLLAGNDTFVLEAFAQTLTNKTINASSNTVTNVGDSAIAAHTSTKITITAKGQLPATIPYEDEANIFVNAQRFNSYVDLDRITIPADPGANIGRFYVKQIDANNDGVFVKLKKAGAIVEVQVG